MFIPLRCFTLLLAASACILSPKPANAVETGFFDSLSGSLGVSLMKLDFKEFDQQDRRLVQESGWLPGITAGAIARKQQVETRFRLSHYRSDVDYDGQTQSGTPISSSTHEKIWDFSASAAYRLPFPLQAYLYAGAGYRHWDRDIQSLSFVAGLEETYHWWSYHGGLELNWEKGGNRWSLDGRLLRTINPEVKIDFLDTFDSATLDLGERWGWRTELQWLHSFTPKVSSGLGLFYERLKLGKSDSEALTRNGTPAGTVFQPHSESRNYGITLELRHSW